MYRKVKSMARSSSWTKSLFVGIWTVLNFSRKLFFNIIFIALAIMIVLAISKDSKKIGVTPNSLLHLDLNGRLVIEKQEVDPFDKFMQEAFEEEDDNPEILVRDLVFALENAAEDKRIEGAVLNVQGLMPSGLDKLRTVAQAIEAFKASGKPIFAVGDYYTRDQYYLAAHANEIYLNPMGAVLVDGYSRFGLYFKGLLDKLKISTHIFRVGTFKSAVEPYMREDMSEAAKQANRAWLGTYWEQYKFDVATARGFDMSNFDEKFDRFLEKFRAVDGSFSEYALQNGWVDELKTREQIRDKMKTYVDSAENKQGYALTSLNTYLSVIRSPLPQNLTKKDTIAIVVASGTILDGNQKAGTIGGDSTARLLREARLDDKVKAVVLRVDSPGGSANASEVIRQEILNLKAAGKPVIAQMGSYAASGGYWISASTDYIVASPSTITGSIGVFGMFLTFEDSLGHIGVNSDGVSTTELADLSPVRALSEGHNDLFQLSVEHTYKNFISLVGSERNLDLQRVDEIAQGRVWIGETALEIGLVDELGDLSNALQKAAELAELDDYDTQYIKRKLSAQELFWKEFFGQAMAYAAQSAIGNTQSPLVGMVKQVIGDFSELHRLNDPQGLYVMCLQCEIN
jgi:protease-4